MGIYITRSVVLIFYRVHNKLRKLYKINIPRPYTQKFWPSKFEMRKRNALFEQTTRNNWDGKGPGKVCIKWTTTVWLKIWLWRLYNNTKKFDILLSENFRIQTVYSI